MEPDNGGDDTSRLLLVLTGGLSLTLAAVMAMVVFAGVRWHVLTSSYQVFLIGVFCGGLLAATIAYSTRPEAWASRFGLVVLLLGVLVTGATHVFFFRLLGGERYVQRLYQLWETMWG